jgi:hypothetical protein
VTDVILPPAPCSTCPFRRDTPPGIWAPEEYQKLPDYDQGGMAFAPFHCHQENVTGVPTLCRGFVSCLQFDSIAVRLLVSREVLTVEQVEAPCPVPLYGSGREACDAGMAGVKKPDQRAVRAITKLESRLARGRRARRTG